ncbi:hypothetical protein G6011_11803 [Alternaria panax]|uniref:Uncharacterized protein n=1 Tax=Alternaria panax TaxID=48097 RepID=A0AAD4F7V4_9PLEO|nr:hypothetical protein G6011_11803 [Alternaria panax]
MEILDEQLIRLKSIISRRQREEVEKEYGMTMKEIQAIRNTYELRQYSVPLLLQEAHNKIFAYTKQSKDDGVIEHMRQLRAFSESVARYIDRVLPMDKAGNRPPRLSRRSGARTSRHGQDCSLTSQSTGTISTQSTQSSHYQTQTPESPPTSPEPPIVKPVINVQLEEEKETTSILNFCQRCSGTCTNTKAHNTSIQYTPPEPASHTIWYPPNTAPIPFSIQANGTARPGIRSRPQVRPAVQTQPSNFNAISASSQRPNTHQSYSPKPTVEPADEVRGSPRINPTTPQGDGDEIHDGEPEEEDSIQEQASGSKKSIWQATGGFEGDVPKGLRIRRQRSRSPQDFW